MAIVFQDGFDYVQDGVPFLNNCKPEWSTVANRQSFASPGVYNNGRYVGMDSMMSVAVPARDTYIVGCHCWHDDTREGAIIDFRRSGVSQCMLVWAADNTVAIRRGSTTLFALPPVFPPGRWFHFEVKATISATVGTVTINIDGVTQATLTSLNNKGGADTLIDEISFGTATITWFVMHLDNVVILNTDGAVNNDMLGETVVRCYYPTADAAVQMTPICPATPGTANWQNVLGTGATLSPDWDASYNMSSVPGDVDLFTMAPLAGTADVKSIDLVSYARKDNTGARTARLVSKLGGTQYESGSTTLNSGYVLVHNLVELNPATSAKWTVADLTAGQFGYKVQT